MENRVADKMVYEKVGRSVGQKGSLWAQQKVARSEFCWAAEKEFVRLQQSADATALKLLAS